ncbi:hypothetical protein ACVWYS_004122 [Arthrobacter sp. TE12231]
MAKRSKKAQPPWAMLSFMVNLARLFFIGHPPLF